MRKKTGGGRTARRAPNEDRADALIDPAEAARGEEPCLGLEPGLDSVDREEEQVDGQAWGRAGRSDRGLERGTFED